MPNLFKKECRKRQEFCETHGIEFKLPRFKSKQGKTSFLLQIITKNRKSSKKNSRVQPRYVAGQQFLKTYLSRI